MPADEELQAVGGRQVAAAAALGERDLALGVDHPAGGRGDGLASQVVLVDPGQLAVAERGVVGLDDRFEPDVAGLRDKDRADADAKVLGAGGAFGDVGGLRGSRSSWRPPGARRAGLTRGSRSAMAIRRASRLGGSSSLSSSDQDEAVVPSPPAQPALSTDGARRSLTRSRARLTRERGRTRRCRRALGLGITALRRRYSPAAHRKATRGRDAKNMPRDCPPTSDADAAPCPTCSRYSCRCDQADEPWTRLAPWTQAFSANA